MRRHSSNPFLSGTSIAMAGISPDWHKPTKMANRSVHNPFAIEIISSGLISSVCAAANLRRSGYSGSTVPIHDVKPNLNRSQSESLPVKDSGALTNLGFNGLRLGSADVADCVVAVN